MNVDLCTYRMRVGLHCTGFITVHYGKINFFHEFVPLILLLFVSILLYLLWNEQHLRTIVYHSVPILSIHVLLHVNIVIIPPIVIFYKKNPTGFVTCVRDIYRNVTFIGW